MNEVLIEKINKALDSIRPYLKADGGDIRISEITDDMTVKIELLGSCGICPMSAMTLKAGVEKAVLAAVPEIRVVEAVNITHPDTIVG